MNNLLLKIGQGKSTHIGHKGVNQSGKEYLISHCGSEVSSKGIKTPRIIGDVDIEKVTCKKCLKQLKEELRAYTE